MIRQPVGQKLKIVCLCPSITHERLCGLHCCAAHSARLHRGPATRVVPLVLAVPSSLAFTAGSMLPTTCTLRARAPTPQGPAAAAFSLCAPSRPRVFVAGALALPSGCHLSCPPDNRKQSRLTGANATPAGKARLPLENPTTWPPNSEHASAPQAGCSPTQACSGPTVATSPCSPGSPRGRGPGQSPGPEGVERVPIRKRSGVALSFRRGAGTALCHLEIPRHQHPCRLQGGL